MKTLQKALFTVAVGSLLSVSAQAAPSYGDGYTGQPYVGVKVGQFDLDVDNSSKPTAYGVYGGYNFDPNFGVEAEYVGSSDADYNGGDIDAKSYGVYGTYRYYFPNTALYGKAKLGVARTKVEGDYNRNNVRNNYNDSSTSVAGGLGLGYSINPNFGVEAEYDIQNSDANLMTVGAHLKF